MHRWCRSPGLCHEWAHGLCRPRACANSFLGLKLWFEGLSLCWLEVEVLMASGLRATPVVAHGDSSLSAVWSRRQVVVIDVAVKRFWLWAIDEVFTPRCVRKHAGRVEVREMHGGGEVAALSKSLMLSSIAPTRSSLSPWSTSTFVLPDIKMKFSSLAQDTVEKKVIKRCTSTALGFRVWFSRMILICWDQNSITVSVTSWDQVMCGCGMIWLGNVSLIRFLNSHTASVVVRNCEQGAATYGNQPVLECDLPQQHRNSHGDATLATQPGYIQTMLVFGIYSRHWNYYFCVSFI